MFEDNVGEDGLSAQSSYTIDINDSNYIDNLASDPTMIDNEVPLGMGILKKVYTQLISALNDVRVQKRTNSTLSADWFPSCVVQYSTVLLGKLFWVVSNLYF
jgi:hypothetical protein